MSRRSRIVGFGSAGLLVLAGIACAFVFSGGLGQNLAFAFVALGLVGGTALIFYEVGLTEDRDRAREEARKASQSGGEEEPPMVKPTSTARQTDHANQLVRPRGALDRIRSHPRRPRRLR
ncbi:MAG TPA: hypothetical protein VMA77_05690 [Solirubrobacteraceae bacterium]|nr:hypothetical protein [Solirubrobacteraceae bacterium]